MPFIRRFTVFLCMACLPASTLAAELMVSAAASLTNAFRDIGRRFEQQHPGTVVRFNFAASGILLQQLRQGAPADVFASADQATMDRAAAEKLVDGLTRRNFAANSVVLVAPARGWPDLATLQDLLSPAVERIGVGKPATVPVGGYTKQALEAAGLWTPLEAKFILADSVRQVLDYVGRGEVDAGFVYRTDAALARDKARVVLTVAGHAPVLYPVAATPESRSPGLARSFIDFLFSEPGREALRRYGFENP